MVGGTPKPFACTSEGCTMTFTNEDHLNVHQRKHEMVLNLGIKSSSIVADQTPTPTRFLRNCEEVGLFQDLQNVNPFEETFRRAVEMVKTGSLPVPDLPEDDTLHTPHVFPHIPDENVSCIYNTHTLKNEKIELKTNLMHATISEKDKNESVLTLSNNSDSSDRVYALSMTKTPTILINDKPNLSLNDCADHVYALQKESPKPESKKANFVIREKKFTATKYRKYVNKNIVDIKPNNVSAKEKLQQILQTKQIKSAENKNAQSVILVQGLKLANSDKIPSNVPEITIVNNMVPVLQTVSELPILPKLTTIPISTQNTVVNTIVKTTTFSSNSFKMIKNSGDTNETRKLDLLERNRAAATRCRERKKQWIGSLENKFNIVCKEKDDLQKENVNLRNEIQHLKALLLAHKDCPVTKAMNMGQNIPIGPPQIITIITKEEENATSGNQEMKPVNKPNISFANQSETSVIVLNDSLIS